MKNEELSRCLKDIGCSDETIDNFMNSDDEKMKIKILEKERATLLKRYHNEARKIDCLDYIIYSLEKKDD